MPIGKTWAHNRARARSHTGKVTLHNCTWARSHVGTLCSYLPVPLRPDATSTSCKNMRLQSTHVPSHWQSLRLQSTPAPPHSISYARALFCLDLKVINLDSNCALVLGLGRSVVELATTGSSASCFASCVVFHPVPVALLTLCPRWRMRIPTYGSQREQTWPQVARAQCAYQCSTLYFLRG